MHLGMDFRLYPDEPEAEYVRCDGPCRQRLEVGQDVIEEFEGETYCERCFSEVTKVCPKCGERDYARDFKGDICGYCTDGLTEPYDVERDNAREES